MVAFALEYVRCPPPSRTTFSDNNVGDAALHFARDNILQRDVEVSFSTVDRVGTFIGKMRVLERSSSDEWEWEKTLLEQGLGYLNEVTREKAPSVLKEKEKIAKENQKGLWSIVSDQNGSNIHKADTVTHFYGIVSEVSGGGRLYVQSEEADSQNTLRTIQSQLAELGIHDTGREIPFSALKVGDKVASKYSVDGQWYRGIIREKDTLTERALVQFVDYGNEEWITYDEIRSLPISTQNIPTVAYGVLVKDIVVPELTEECGIEAGEALRDLVWNKRVLVQGTKRIDVGSGIPQITADVFVEDGQERKNVAVELLQRGLARIIRRKDAESRAAHERYGKDEQLARRAHRFLWRFGDAYASDEDMDK